MNDVDHPRIRYQQITLAQAIVSGIAGEALGGRYSDDCNEAPTVDHRDADGIGVASYALDHANADRLWDVSESLLQRA
jgi:hypothetical protein